MSPSSPFFALLACRFLCGTGVFLETKHLGTDQSLLSVGLRGNAHVQVTSDRSRAPDYHTVQETFDRLQALSQDGTCKVPLKTEWIYDETETKKGLFVVRLGKQDAKKNIMLAANEHAREVITAEVALHFVELMCGAIDSSSALTLPENVMFTILPIINVGGRKLVDNARSKSDAGACQRYTIDEGVGEIDLNRNMEVDFKPDLPGGTMEGHGTTPFSAYQSRVIRDLADTLKPLAFVDLHSGFRSLMVSWGLQPHTSEDYEAQCVILDEIKANYCPDCVIGSNRVVIGYENAGEVIDHMYARAGVKYSTLWEVFVGPGSPCWAQFNPPKEDLMPVLGNWTKAIEAMAVFIDGVAEDDHSRLQWPNETQRSSGLIELSPRVGPAMLTT